MAMAVELRCPGCTEVLARFRRARRTVGRPFEECPKCRTFVNRPSTNEWDLLGAAGKTAWLADRVVVALALGLVPALAYWALVFRHGRGDPSILLVLLGAGALIGFLPLSVAVQTIRRSRSRMADPMYRARLIEFMRRTPTVDGPKR